MSNGFGRSLAQTFAAACLGDSGRNVTLGRRAGRSLGSDVVCTRRSISRSLMQVFGGEQSMGEGMRGKWLLGDVSVGASHWDATIRTRRGWMERPVAILWAQVAVLGYEVGTQIATIAGTRRGMDEVASCCSVGALVTGK